MPFAAASISKEKRSSVSSVHAAGAAAPAVTVAIGATSVVTAGVSIGSGNGHSAISSNLSDSTAIAANIKTNSNSDLSNIATSGSIINNAKNLKTQPAAAANSGLNTSSNNDAANPMKQSLVTIEHKIRNLEKRKTKLESYRAIQATGKDLSSDQIAAVAKYDAVIATLEFARDLSKQMLQFCKDAEKEQKKQARKEVIARAIAETVKIREVLVMQNVLSCFTDEAVRADFLAGDNGAVKLESTDLDAMEKFCIDIQTRRPETNDDVPFIQTAQKAAELFSMTIDARPKQYGEATFEKLRNVFAQIQDCGYLDKIYMTPDQVNAEVVGNVSDEQLLNTDNELDAGSETTGQNSIEDGLDKLHLEQQHTTTAVGDSNLQQRHHPQQMQTREQQLGEPLLPAQAPVAVSAANAQQQQQQLQPILAQSAQVLQAQPAAGFGQQQPPPIAQSGSTTPVHVLYAANQSQGAPPLVPQTGASTVSGGILQPPPQGTPLQQPQLIGGAYQRQFPDVIMENYVEKAELGSSESHFPATTVRAVEQNYFKQQQQHHQQPVPAQQQPHNPQQQQQQQQQFMQQLRPLAEVIGSGSFYFLQDSELDSPEVNAQQLQQQQPQPVAGLIFEQSQQQPKPQQVPPNNHVDELQQQQLQQHQSSQTIQTQTFTNQSFPPLQPQPQATVLTLGNTNAPSPLYQQQQQQQQQPPQQQQAQKLYSPVTAPQLQLLQHEHHHQRQQQQQQQPPQQQPMLIMLGMQPGEVIPHPNAAAFATAPHFDGTKAGVTVSAYEQQLQQQLSLKAAAAAATALVNSTSSNSDPEAKGGMHVDELNIGGPGAGGGSGGGGVGAAGVVSGSGGIVIVNSNNNNSEWHSRNINDTNATATAALTNVLKTNSSALAATAAANAVVSPTGVEASSSSGNNSADSNATNKWSTEMNALGTPNTTPTSISNMSGSSIANNNNSNNSNNNVTRTKGDWVSTPPGGRDGGGGYADAVASRDQDGSTSNHWGQDNGSGNGRRNSGNYSHRRNGGGDRGMDDRRQDERDRGARGGYRNRNYGGGGSGAGSGGQQQNGRGNSGVYFRNNDPSSAGGANSYYNQNGGGSGGAYVNKDTRYDSSSGSGSGGNYRGPRANNPRSGGGGGSGPYGRSALGNRGGGSGGGSGGGGPASNSSGAYISRSNRLPIGLENKN